MAVNMWRGDAPAVAKVRDYTPASVTVGNIFTLTCNGKTISYTAAAATVADVTAGLKALYDATSIAEFQEATAEDNTTKLTLTARNAGVPFTITSSAAQGTGSAGMTFVASDVTANSGPNDGSIAANWTLNAVPSGTDDVLLDNTGISILYGLPTVGSPWTVNSWKRTGTYTGQLGLPDWNTSGYYEYRQKIVSLVTATVTLGDPVTLGGPQLERYDFGGQTSMTVIVYSTGQASSANGLALTVTNSGASSVIDILQGSVGLCVNSGETSTFQVKIGYEGNPASDVRLVAGSGASISGAAFQQYGGVVFAQANLGTVTVIAGTITLQNAVTVTTLTLDRDGATNTGSVCKHLSSGTITTLKVNDQCLLDNIKDPRAKTITNSTVYFGGSIQDPSKLITFTNPTLFDHCNPFTDCPGLNLGSNLSLARS